MAHSYNPTFKPPSSAAPARSPSPPTAFVEPLSPARPRPIEPHFNYPPINNHVDFAVPPDTSTATPRAGDGSPAQQRDHRRTPSTIDALADAALAGTPSYASTKPNINTNGTRKRSLGLDTNGPTLGLPTHHNSACGGSEPPHKRTRSELLPSSPLDPYLSRPATSYEPGTSTNPAQPGHIYNSRVEEAALLLNFQSGGWPASGPAPAPGASGSLQPPSHPSQRPHANSFPQDPSQARLAEAAAHPVLLPPFRSDDALPSAAPGASELQSLSAGTAAAQTEKVGDQACDVKMIDPFEGFSEEDSHRLKSPETHPDDSMLPLAATDEAASEAAEAWKSRRGWPKGKPRGSCSKRSSGEKSSSRRTSSRKKSADAKAGRGKTEDLVSDWVDRFVRRKSFSHARLLDELERRHSLSTSGPPRASSVPPHVSMTIRPTSPTKPPRRKAAVTPETVCAGCSIAREATNSRGEMDEWICCNGCKQWFHIDCAGFKKVHELRDVDKFFCTACESQHGKTTYVRKSTRAHASVDYAELQRGVLKTSEESVEHHYIQPIKDGTFTFDPEFFPRMRPEMVTREFFEKSGTFVEPICIPAEWNPRPWHDNVEDELKREEDAVEGDAVVPDFLHRQLPEHFEYEALPDNGQDRLEMIMPEELTVREVCNLVGPDTPLDVIDVKTQNSGSKWNLGRWADYYEDGTEEKAIRNVISLEVSQTKLGRLLQRPKIVRDIDLQDDIWPQEEIDKGKWPKVQFYCLMSVADSYTDFHIDFGGSSVYYHILRGKKTFFFIPPKAKHLKAYEEWNDSPQQNYTFLPSITKECYRVDLHEGDTMLIPSGWIHAVWTPADSLVIGGNFLNRMSYKNQFKVVDIEKANETPMKFRYPFFQKIMWYTAIKYLRDDPLPASVSQLFYEGRRFDREQPVWADFDGVIAAVDDRPGATNARYYSQAEIDGLPDLVNFIFRTVMLVLGRIEGVSQDRMKRVNTSIPKGHGEPLEVAKTFALWVAWKRGNEDPPAWAHPDAVLPNKSGAEDDSAAPKKLSERKLKELERREAIAAWRIAPDRQSARVMSKNAAAAAAATATSSAGQTQELVPVNGTPMPYYVPGAGVDDSLLMPGGQYLSTPKTSVLGPKRVACDACRKRRIRCKHKDMVVQTQGSGSSAQLDAGASVLDQLPQAGVTAVNDVYDNIQVAATQQQHSFVNLDANGAASNPVDGMENGDVHMSDVPNDGQGPLPGTNAYLNANIPMTMNGVAIFGETPKRGRSKACYECRKSKRRCIHDEQGNVDPVKAAENPTPRRSLLAPKRMVEEDGSPVSHQPRKRQQLRRPSNAQHSYSPIHHHSQMNGLGILRPDPIMNGATYQPNMTRTQSTHVPDQHTLATPQTPPTHHQKQQSSSRPPEIDPNLFDMYTNGSQGDTPYSNSYHSPSASNLTAAAATGRQSRPQHQHAVTSSQQTYQLPSLEQIANEVLVDMTGNDLQDPTNTVVAGSKVMTGAQQQQQPSLLERGLQTYESTHDDPMASKSPQENGVSKTAESVDSAVSISNSGDNPADEEGNVPNHANCNEEATKGNGEQSSGDRLTSGVDLGQHAKSNGFGGYLTKKEATAPDVISKKSVNGPVTGELVNDTMRQIQQFTREPDQSDSSTANKLTTNALPAYQPPAPLRRRSLGTKRPSSSRSNPVFENGDTAASASRSTRSKRLSSSSSSSLSSSLSSSPLSVDLHPNDNVSKGDGAKASSTDGFATPHLNGTEPKGDLVRKSVGTVESSYESKQNSKLAYSTPGLGPTEAEAEAEKRSLDLARALRQEGMGLRRRGAGIGGGGGR